MKKLFAFLMSCAAAVMLMGTVMFRTASAAAVLPTDTSSPRPGCVFLGIEGKYITQIQESLDLINSYRLEACREGIKIPERDKPLTMDDYVPIQWSSDMEYVARIRAAEASVTIAHQRLNGESIWGLKSPNGEQSWGEILAWNWSDTMTYGIEQWYEEKKDLVNETPGAVVGHYTQMIDPNNHYVGLATFCSNYGVFYNSTAGEFARQGHSGLDTSRGQSTGNIIQTLEVRSDCISYNISGSDTLSVSASIDYGSVWGTAKNLTLLGESADDVQWSSSNNNVVTVSNGKLTVKSCGSAVITAKLPGGKTLTKPVSYQHSYRSATTEATCKSEGKVVKTCSVCGKTDTQTLPKTNKHSFGSWVTTKNPTESSNGMETRTCAVCGTTETRTLRYESQDTSSSPNNSSDVSSTDTSSGDSSSDTPPDNSSGDTSSETSSDNSSSDIQSGGTSFESSSDNGSSETSSDNDTSGPSSNDSSTEGASNADTSSDSSIDAAQSDSTSDSGSSSLLLPIIFIGGVIAAGAIVIFIVLLNRRKKK